MGERIPSISLVEKTLGTEKRKLVLQPLGKIVIDVLSQHFAPLFDYGYTAEMEGRLDAIGNGSEKWEKVCMSCRDSVSELLAPLGDVQNKGIIIDDQHTYIVGKHGPVIKKTLENGEVSFLPTKPDIDMDRLLSSGGCTLEDVVRPQAGPISLGRHKDHTVTLKTGRYGPYVEWNDIRRSVNVSPEKSYTEITLKDVLPVLSDSGGRSEIRKLDRYTSIRSGPRGDYIFHKQPRWKRPKFYPLAGFVRTHCPDEYKTCGIKTLSAWLLKEHKLKLVA
jgi:DNA topoisomerase-1